MAHDYKTRTIDYSEEHPPKWATPQEQIDFYPKRVAKFISEEVKRAEERLAAQKATEEDKVAKA